eukprot:4322075-Pyramimonas_sp.AAC.1
MKGQHQQRCARLLALAFLLWGCEGHRVRGCRDIRLPRGVHRAMGGSEKTTSTVAGVLGEDSAEPVLQ